MTRNLRDIERTWVAGSENQAERQEERARRLIGWWVFTLFLLVMWMVAWLGGGTALGRSLQALYGVDAQIAPLWQRADAHMHALGGFLLTLWGAWGGRLFTPVGFWLGPPVAVVVVIMDELLQLGQADRSFEWGDQIAGSIGILAGCGALMLYRFRGDRAR